MEFSTDFIRSLQGRLETDLPPPIYSHSLNVAECAKQIAQRYGYEDTSILEVAGLLHDNCKHFSTEELKEAMSRYRYAPNVWELKTTGVIHARVGALRATYEYGIAHPMVYQAIHQHTTGGKAASSVSRILYAADKISIDRNFNGVDKLRKAVDYGLTRLCFEIASASLLYLVNERKIIVPDTLEFYNELLEELKVGKAL